MQRCFQEYIDNTFEDSYEESTKIEEYVCFKVSREYDTKVPTLTYNKIFKGY